MKLKLVSDLWAEAYNEIIRDGSNRTHPDMIQTEVVDKFAEKLISKCAESAFSLTDTENSVSATYTQYMLEQRLHSFDPCVEPKKYQDVDSLLRSKKDSYIAFKTLEAQVAGFAMRCCPNDPAVSTILGTIQNALAKFSWPNIS